MPLLDLILGIVLVVVNLFWMFLVILGLPGTWLMAGSMALVAWWRWDETRGPDGQMFGVAALAIVFGLAVLGEIVEFGAGMVGARRAGASFWGTIGALLGAFIGGLVATFVIPIPIAGSLIGACGGAAVGAWLLELGAGRTEEDASRSAVGAGVGRLQGTLIKLGMAAVMWVVVAVAAFWP